MKSTTVVATDNDTGESDSQTVTNDYVLICDGTCYLASSQTDANGTHVLTIKGRKR